MSARRARRHSCYNKLIYIYINSVCAKRNESSRARGRPDDDDVSVYPIYNFIYINNTLIRCGAVRIGGGRVGVVSGGPRRCPADD